MSDYCYHSEYWAFVNRYIPNSKQPLLSEILDHGDDTESHLLELAQSIYEWEEKLVGPLKLTSVDVNDIHEIHHNKPELKRYI